MAFLETPRFPNDLKYGSLGGPMFSTDIVVTGGGVEFRNSNWSLPLSRYDAKYSVKLRSSAIDVYELFMVSNGKDGSFRYKDFWDYRSSSNGVDAVADTDQSIGPGDGASVAFQLVKTYTKGTGSIIRTIKKPVVSAGVLIKVNSVAQTEGVDYTVDYVTGIVTFSVAPTDTHVITAGYEFDVPVRFDTDELSDLFFELMSTAGSDNDIVNYPSIPLIEVRV